jgi:SMC interacting uncharacterized protein involved in chromosome segregation
MPLTLQPLFSNQTKEQALEWLEQVRARRMQAAMEYHHGQTLKLEREEEVLQRRIRQQYELLGKDINRMEALDEKIQERLNKLTMLLQECETVQELINA